MSFLLGTFQLPPKPKKKKRPAKRGSSSTSIVARSSEVDGNVTPGHQPQEGASAERDSKKRKLKGPAIASIFTHRQGLGEPYGAAGIGLSLCMPEDSIVGLAMEAAPRRPLEKAAIEENVDPTTLMNANGILAALRFADEAAGVEACCRREGTARQTRKPEELTLVRVKVNGDDGVYLERVKKLDEVKHVIVYLRQSTVQEGLGNKLAGQAVTIASALLGKSLPEKVSASRFVELGTASRSRCPKDRGVLMKAAEHARCKGKDCALVVAALSRLSRRPCAYEDLRDLVNSVGAAVILVCIPQRAEKALIGEQSKGELEKYMRKAASTSDGHAVYTASHFMLKSGATRFSVASQHHDPPQELLAVVEHVVHVLRTKVQESGKLMQENTKPFLIAGIARTSPETDVTTSTSLHVQRCLLLFVLLRVKEELPDTTLLDITLLAFGEDSGGSRSEEAHVAQWVKEVCDDRKYAGGVLLCTRADRMTREQETLGTIVKKCCEANFSLVCCLTQVDAVIDKKRQDIDAVARVLAGGEDDLAVEDFVKERARALIRAWTDQPTVRVLVAACSLTLENYCTILREEGLDFLHTFQQYCHVHCVSDQFFQDGECGHGLVEQGLERVFSHFVQALEKGGEGIKVHFENACFPSTATSVTQEEFFTCPCPGVCSVVSTTTQPQDSQQNERCVCACTKCKKSRRCFLADSNAKDKDGDSQRKLRSFDASACPCKGCSSSLSVVEGKTKFKPKEPITELPKVPTEEDPQALRCICCDLFGHRECPLAKEGVLTPLPWGQRKRPQRRNYRNLLSDWCWYCHRFIRTSEFNQWCSETCFVNATRLVNKKKLWEMTKETHMKKLKSKIGFWFCTLCQKKQEPELTLVPINSSYGSRCLRCSHNNDRGKIHTKYDKRAQTKTGRNPMEGQRNVGSGREKAEKRKAKELIDPHPMLLDIMMMKYNCANSDMIEIRGGGGGGDTLI